MDDASFGLLALTYVGKELLMLFSILLSWGHGAQEGAEGLPRFFARVAGVRYPSDGFLVLGTFGVVVALPLFLSVVAWSALWHGSLLALGLLTGCRLTDPLLSHFLLWVYRTPNGSWPNPGRLSAILLYGEAILLMGLAVPWSVEWMVGYFAGVLMFAAASPIGPSGALYRRFAEA